MSAFQKFKARKQAQKSQLPKAQTTPNQALTLLAKLLNVTEAQAIAEAEKYIESNITFFEERVTGIDESVTVELNPNEHGIHTQAEAAALAEAFTETGEAAAQQLEQTAEAATEQLNSAANNVELSADDLAYTTADINNATAELKEATEEIKKPSGARRSSNSKKETKQKSNSKK